MTRQEPGPSKAAVRKQILSNRKERSTLQISDTSQALARYAVGDPRFQNARTIAAYVSAGTEPGTAPLIAAAVAAGKTVLLPILMADNDLDWGPFNPTEPGGGLIAGPMNLRQPPAPGLGVEAIAQADLVIVPGLATSPTGDRLGRGGGSYDRALARVLATTPVWIALYPEELLESVPTEPHDRRVGAALTSSGIVEMST